MTVIFSMHTGRGGFLGNWINSIMFGTFGTIAYLYAYTALGVTLLALTKKLHLIYTTQKVAAILILITVLMLLLGLLDNELIFIIRSEGFVPSLSYAWGRGVEQAGFGILAALLLYWLVLSIGRMGTGILSLSIAAAAIWLSTPKLVLSNITRLKKTTLGLHKALLRYRNQRSIKKNLAKGNDALLDEVKDHQIATFPSKHLLIEHETARKSEIHVNMPGDSLHAADYAPDIEVKQTVTGEADQLETTLRNQLEKKEANVITTYRKPPLTLLKPKKIEYQRTDRKKMLEKAKLLEETLASFGVEARVIKVTQGPTITRYELQPSKGVKVSKVVNLNDDIALNLAASSIRIEAPIPGKAAIGIEIPNDEVSIVPLRELLDTREYKEFKNPLPFVLGKNIAGDTVVSDINKMPHLLVAGATGSGKSVCINSLILSLLFKSRPDEVKLLMIDPKVVELNQYNGIPHLMIPVVTDPKKATGALRWAVTEMEERYHKFAENGVRDIGSFNEKIAEEKLPYIVVIIDELADLMLVAPKEVEDYICRLAQMARAAGIHLIVATQRPSVDVITGIIKANIPSRVAFSVASQVDSRIILDMGGAEKLLGKGDMLFHPIGLNKPIRIQGAFVSDEEVKRVVDFLKDQSGEPDYEEDILERIESVTDQAEEHEPDDMFQEALRIAFDNQQISISMLQRKLKMGYNRAARLIDEMEVRGYVGPNEGTKPRKIINRPANNQERSAE